MKTFKILAISIAAVTFIVTASAQSTKYDTATILRDADYILNRYEEVSLLVNIDAWTTSADVKARANAARDAISNSVEHRKRQLSAMLTRQNSTSPELLDVYAELLEVSGELGDLAYQSAEWGIPNRPPILRYSAVRPIPLRLSSTPTFG